ncbi:MAG: hypothetical protein KF833_06305 [Verrucomicrobiae bacterium]|nr:hypothetical protein [Verrucomicrobiae bacterium]
MDPDPEPEPSTPPPGQTRGRRLLRATRIAALAGILLLLALMTWLRLAGIPGFLRKPIEEALAQHGVTAEFGSLRFHWFRGLVAENLRVAWLGPDGPRLTLDEADLNLAPPPWRHRGVVRGLVIRHGTLVIPLPLSNHPPRHLTVERIHADLRFLPNDAWEISRFSAQSLGLHLELRAHLTHAAALRQPRPPTPDDPDALLQRTLALRSLIDELTLWSAPTPPRLELNVALDGRQPWDFRADAYLHAPALLTPHGEVRQFRLGLRVQPPPDPERPATSSVTLDIDELQSPHGGWTGLAARLDSSGPPRPALPTNAHWTASVEHLFLPVARARQLVARGEHTLLPPHPGTPAHTAPTPFPELPLLSHVHAEAAAIEAGPAHLDRLAGTRAVLDLTARHPAAPRPPEHLDLRLELASLNGAPGTLGPTRIEGRLQHRPDPGEPPPDLAWWSHLWPYHGQLDLSLAQLRSPRLDLDRLQTRLDWQPPLLLVPHLEAALHRGDVQLSARLDVPARLASAEARTTFDLHAIDGLLGERSRTNFQRYQWQDPPTVHARAQARLEPWSQPRPDWDGAVKPTLRLDGRFEVGPGSFKGIPFLKAASSLSYDGAWWRLPDLRTERPEGRQEIAVAYHEDSQEYRVDARGPVHPPVLKPILGEHTADILDLFQFDRPVEADLSVWGPWSEGTRQAILGSLTLPPFTFRNQRFDRLDASVHYTNAVLVAAPARLLRDAGEARAEGVRYDFSDDLLTLTNAISTLDPAVLAAAIGPTLPERIAPYRFDTPPTVRVQGSLRTQDIDSADLDFHISGGPFRFWRLSADRLDTRLLWKGPDLLLTNLHASFYRGTLEGHAAFDLRQPDDTGYRFEARVRDASLADLLREATPGRTNLAEGAFDLVLDIHSARTADLHSWNGSGQADLRNGLLWNVPIFGFLSPVLNSVVPGLGNNRAERASSTFTLTNSVILTRDLVINCPPAKLLYRGTIDFDQRIDARVEGQILTDIIGIGPIFGLVLRPLTKLLEFRVTGTLAEIESEPLYIPKLLLLPLQPMKVLRGLFGLGDDPAPKPPPDPPPDPNLDPNPDPPPPRP